MADDTVLITGCSSGIGRATALQFLEDDWTVYATSRDTDDVTDLVEKGCKTASLDVTNDDDVAAVVDKIEADTGRVDCLVNNAGYAQHGPLEDIPPDRLQHQFDVNVFGPHRLIRAVLPLMREQGDGTIINMSSVNGRVSNPGGGAYAGSKFAMEAMSDALRLEVDRQGIDVVLIEPGPVATAFNDRLQAELEELEQTDVYDWLYETIIDVNATVHSLPITVEAEDIATLVVDVANLSNPAARYPAGPVAKFLIASAMLPDRLQDATFRLVRKLA